MAGQGDTWAQGSAGSRRWGQTPGSLPTWAFLHCELFSSCGGVRLAFVCRIFYLVLPLACFARTQTAQLALWQPLIWPVPIGGAAGSLRRSKMVSEVGESTEPVPFGTYSLQEASPRETCLGFGIDHASSWCRSVMGNVTRYCVMVPLHSSKHSVCHEIIPIFKVL